jgi:hypothetical protein
MREVFQTQLPVVFGLRFTYAFATTIVVMAHYYFPRYVCKEMQELLVENIMFL